MPHKINVDRLPAAEDIDHTAIAAAAAAHASAQQSLQDTQRALGRLEDGREEASWRDARDADEALAAGKPMPKRKHVAEHDRKAFELQHEVKVRQLAVQRTRQELQQAVDAHGADWAADLDQQAAALDQAWGAAVGALQTLHQERLAAHARRRVVGGQMPSTSILLEPGKLFDNLTGDRLQLAWLGDPGQRYRQRVGAHLADILAAMRGEPEPDAPMAGSLVADRLKASFEHARSVERGFSDEEIRQNTAPAIHVNGRPVSVYTGRGDEGES